MASKSLAHSLRNFSTVSSFCNASTISRTTYTTISTFRPKVHRSISVASRPVSVTAGSLTWDDVVHVSLPESFQDDPADLTGYFEKVKLCNRGSDTQSEFFPFVIDGQIVGYMHHGFVKHLQQYPKVFTRDDSVKFGAFLTLHESLKTPEDRTRAVGDVVKCLGEEVIPGTRNEVYGVHMNGYVEKEGKKFLWVAKRSQTKPTFPGMLDHLVAGGLPQGIPCGENLMKECQEEAGIPRSISKEAIPVGAISYTDIKGYGYKRDVQFCYDLKLPESFVPENQDGEVEGFMLLPVTNVANVIRRTQFFKPNCSLVIIDFLFRHGAISAKRGLSHTRTSLLPCAVFNMTTPESSMSGSSNASTPITSSELEAQLNPFVLHHSIIPTTNLVSTPLTGSNNYSSWNRAMMLALSGKNKMVHNRCKRETFRRYIKPESSGYLELLQSLRGGTCF
ncbi:nudix hydrolase 20, chloroplastic isoform X2 [Cucumis sativus]|uniref:nudix hydrolase 20, chloroplastic isoform X2 n=1 Tax=Cucumis sativus TaxID=3659 RepID=UPI0012F48F0D|nr:nudix hydrolase 20, chloroplastic isoform X2 [Cucumis sativus]